MKRIAIARGRARSNDRVGEPVHDSRYSIASVGSENSISASSVATIRP